MKDSLCGTVPHHEHIEYDSESICPGDSLTFLWASHRMLFLPHNFPTYLQGSNIIIVDYGSKS